MMSKAPREKLSAYLETGERAEDVMFSSWWYSYYRLEASKMENGLKLQTVEMEKENEVKLQKLEMENTLKFSIDFYQKALSCSETNFTPLWNLYLQL